MRINYQAKNIIPAELWEMGDKLLVNRSKDTSDYDNLRQYNILQGDTVTFLEFFGEGKTKIIIKEAVGYWFWADSFLRYED